MKKKPLASARTLLSLGIGLAIGFPTQADPPPWAAAHGQRAKEVEVREYRYVYYPTQQVYFAPETRSWFWLNGSAWQGGLNLPAQRHVNAASGGVSVLLNTPRPYVEHVYVEEHYGRPWRERHKGKERQRMSNRRHSTEGTLAFPLLADELDKMRCVCAAVERVYGKLSPTYGA
jgi:hypothetical protein